jgi:DNA topoisomerase-2
MRNKPLNVRDMNIITIMSNRDIRDLSTVLGLEYGHVYMGHDNLSGSVVVHGLRYGRIVIVSDSDVDGILFRGLIVNIFATLWPSLTRVPGFLSMFIVPTEHAMRIKKSDENDIFRDVNDMNVVQRTVYTDDTYNQLAVSNVSDGSRQIRKTVWLGACTKADVHRYFKDFDRYVVDFIPSDQDRDREAMDVAFSRKSVTARRNWILKYQTNEASVLPIDNHIQSISPVLESGYSSRSRRQITFLDFINRDLAMCAVESNVRNIPDIFDGLKPIQRMVIHTCLSKIRVEGGTKTFNVVQLAGSIITSADSECMCPYRETSITMAIIHMSQDFVGSNNCNILVPLGQFGTRIQSGKDHASPRYLLTRVHDIARTIFGTGEGMGICDEAVRITSNQYQYVYGPMIPMVLVNGASGIGTGWSTCIPSYNPRDIIHILVEWLREHGDAYINACPTNVGYATNGDHTINIPACVAASTLVPWYRGYIGNITHSDDGRAVCIYGVIQDITVFDSGPDSVSDTNVISHDGSVPPQRQRRHTGDVIRVRVSEIPVGISTDTYKLHLTRMLNDGHLVSVEDMCTDCSICFECVVAAGKSQSWQELEWGLMRSIPLNNMTLCDEGRIRRFNSIQEIIERFIELRVRLWKRQRVQYLDALTVHLSRLQRNHDYVDAVLTGKIDVFGRHDIKVPTDIFTYVGDPDDQLRDLPVREFSRDRLEVMSTQLYTIRAHMRNISDENISNTWIRELCALDTVLQSHQTQRSDPSVPPTRLSYPSHARRDGIMKRSRQSYVVSGK